MKINNTPRILIVDDEVHMCESLKMLLGTKGYEIQTAYNGREAIACLANNNLDLVLLDLTLPDIDGYTLLDNLYCQSPDILVIIMTGYASLESAVQTLRKGAYDYLKKPFEHEELLKTIKNALDHKRLEKERKKAEEENYRLEAQLKRSEKMETIGTLAGGIAHDLNNILGAIVGYPDLLLDEIPEDSPLKSGILAIKESGLRAAGIVNDLLTLARRGVNATKIVNLNTIIAENLQNPEFEKLKEFHPAVKIETNLEADLLNVIGSSVHLSKAVINLVFNAAEAMPDGGKVLISTENKYLDKPVKGYDSITEGDHVVLTVSDNGIGISKEDLEKIFEPFYTRKVMGRSGTGLGMAVVWGTVKDHNGYIDVESREGKGTTFKLYFPATRKEIESEKADVSVEQYTGNGERILVIDDVDLQKNIAANLLKKLKYNVKAVSSGEKAIEYMKDNSADLLLLDMIMDPGIDGLETYKRILEIHSNQKAVIASGFSETDRVKKAQKLGAGVYIKKPYTLEKIGLAVKAELEKQS